MTVHRTTEHCFASAGLRLALLFGIVCAAATTQPVLAAPGLFDDDFRVRLVSDLPSVAPWSPDLLVEGTWPDACPPELVRTSLVDAHIDLFLRKAGSRCAETPAAITLRTNPAGAMGLHQLALGVYQVRVYLSQPDGSDALVGMRLLRSGGLDTAARPESGFWWSVPTAVQGPALAGSGLSIEQQGETLAVSLLSYEAGAPVWFFGSARMPGNIVRIPLLRMVGGDEPFGPADTAPRAESGLSLNLQFLGPAHAQAWLARPGQGGVGGIEVQELNLLRLPFESDRDGAVLRGQWALVVDDAREARIIELVDLLSAGADSFSLRDRSGEVVLQCRLDEIGGHAAPAFCSLSDRNGVLADFDRVGLDRLSGLNTDGRPARLLRLRD